MPYLFAVNAQYSGGKYSYDPRELIANFPFLEGMTVTGKIVSMYKDGRTRRINELFRSKIVKTTASGMPPRVTYTAEIVDPNPMKARGLPLPLDVLLVVYKYQQIDKEKEAGLGTIEFESGELPIAEGILLRGSVSTNFEDEVKRILKEQESSMLLEGTVFSPKLEKSSQMASEALVSFEQESYAQTKTSCRKIIEGIKQIASGWKTIDRSESLCQKLQDLVGKLYSFASIGGPHEGVATKEETEFILKGTMSLLFYCNSILKSERVSLEQ